MKRIILFLLTCPILLGTAQNIQVNKPQLENPKSSSMILLPDPQTYTKFDTNQPIFDLMTAWWLPISSHCLCRLYFVRVI